VYTPAAVAVNTPEVLIIPVDALLPVTAHVTPVGVTAAPALFVNVNPVELPTAIVLVMALTVVAVVVTIGVTVVAAVVFACAGVSPGVARRLVTAVLKLSNPNCWPPNE